MAKSSKLSLIIPILMITVGTGWLLTVHKIIPGVDWIWTLGLAIVGVLLLALGGLDKVTIVTGPFLLISSIFSVLRQTERISIDSEIPILVIIAGVLVLISRSLPIEMPNWIIEDSKDSES